MTFKTADGKDYEPDTLTGFYSHNQTFKSRHNPIPIVQN